MSIKSVNRSQASKFKIQRIYHANHLLLTLLCSLALLIKSTPARADIPPCWPWERGCEAVYPCSPSYKPQSYRPGTTGWTGKIGKIAFNNGTLMPVLVKLYSPDNPDLIFQSWLVQPGQNIFLGNNSYGMDWGIQIGESSLVCIVGRIAEWNQFNGRYIFQIGTETSYPKKLVIPVEPVLK